MPKTLNTAINRIDDDWKFQTTDEQKETELYSADAVVNTYLRWKIDQDVENERILKENLDKAMNLCESFSNTLQVKNVKFIRLLLRPKQITEFEAVFIIDKEDYISPRFEEIYKLAISEKTKANSETFHFSYIFIPDTESLDRDKLSSDGYVLEYVKK